MLIDLLLFVVGLAGLYFGAEWLVGGSVRLAAAFGVSSFIIGLTLVSMGTSAPELVVSGLASYQGNGGLSVGNVLGSNIANIGLILGVAALMVTISVHRELLTRDLPIMIVVTLIVLALGWSGDLVRFEGAILLVVFVGYLGVLAYAARQQSRAAIDMSAVEELETADSTPAKDAMLALGGLVVLAVGAQMLVMSAVSIAEVIGVPDVVIGLTMVAFGTSLPELAATISAARRNEGDIVLGNIIGSNIFNITLILGVSSLIRPLPFSTDVLHFDALVVLGLSLALVPILWTKMSVRRLEGGLLVASYVAFILWTAL